MKLSEKQIAHIKKFVHARGFTDLEVETEILDHVASAVERELDKAPDLTLDEALYNVHLSFGLFGFDNIENAVKHSLRQHVWLLFKTIFRKQWSTSKRLITNLAIASIILLLFHGLQQIVHIVGFNHSMFATTAIISILPLIYNIKLFRSWRKRSMLTGKLLIPYAGMGFWISYILQFIPIDEWNGTPLMTGFLIIVSLWLSTNLLAGFSLVEETRKWTYERWLKYQV